jgi:hypothetical protein
VTEELAFEQLSAESCTRHDAQRPLAAPAPPVDHPRNEGLAGSAGPAHEHARLRRCHPPRTVVITAFASIETAVEAMRRGAADYLSKPFSPDRVRLVAALLESRHPAMQTQPGRGRAELRDQVEPILLPEPHVDECEIAHASRGGAQRLRGVCRRDHRMAVSFETRSQRPPQVRLVVDDQDRESAHPSSAARDARRASPSPLPFPGPAGA